MKISTGLPMSAKSIDVVMLTKNSNKWYFRRVLAAIKREIPVHHFIVVDRYSTDGTIDVIREFFGNRVVVIKTDAPLGGARYIGMKAVDTEWFAFIDSDVEILPGWFKQGLKYMKNRKIWGIQGGFSGRSETRDILLKSPRLYFSLHVILRHGIVKFYGADTSHVILRRCVVDLVDPHTFYHLDCGEDAYIAWKIVESGHLYVKTSKMLARHYAMPRLALVKSFYRSIRRNGIFYAVPYSEYTLSNLIRLLTSFYRRDVFTALTYLINIMGSAISYLRTKRTLLSTKLLKT